MTDPSANLERLHDLLADRATQGLDADGQAELARLLAALPDEDPHAFDVVAASVDAALESVPADPLPASVRARVAADAAEWLAKNRQLSLVGTPPQTTKPSPVVTGAARRWAPWLVAAAGVALAIFAWWPTPAEDPQAALDALRAVATTQELPWQDALGGPVTGSVVWNNQRQEGFLRLRNLPVNDPSDIQYQLWIFDAKRNEQFNAVDGGVFNVTGPGEVLVRIRPKLEVFSPTLFAVTTEATGGVVKHDPDLNPEKYRIVLVAREG